MNELAWYVDDMKITERDIQISDTYGALKAIMEADIKEAHGELFDRPKLSAVTEEFYSEVVRQEEFYRDLQNEQSGQEDSE